MSHPTDIGEDPYAIARRLRHHDPYQLAFMAQEVFGDRIYMRHGIQVGPGSVVLDVGANVGVTAAFFSQLCRATTVHAFEPVDPLFELLEANVSAFPGCYAHHHGLGARNGHAAITYYPRAGAMSGLYADPVQDAEAARRYLMNRGYDSDRIDEMLVGVHDPQAMVCELRRLSDVLREQSIERVDLLKIDVERAEVDVLAGIDDTDWPRIRQIIVEVHDEDGRCAQVAAQLEARGFVVAVDQDPEWRGTPLYMLYARR